MMQSFYTRFCASSQEEGALIVLAYLIVIIWTTVILFGPLWLVIKEQEEGDSKQLWWCPLDTTTSKTQTQEQEEQNYDNPNYITNPCRYYRTPRLLGMTLEECDMCQRLLVSAILGGAIGFERRASDRPAGVRTMGLVSLGACFFTISSMLAFQSSPMTWDASRVAAALPSGVGFLGAALIYKGIDTNNNNNNNDNDKKKRSRQPIHQVHGLTTAASVWLSAAIGVGAGGALYFVTFYSTILILGVLRYGPRLYLQQDQQDDEDDEDDEDDDEEEEDDDEEEEGNEGYKDDNEQRQQEQRLQHSQRQEERTKIPFKQQHLRKRSGSGSVRNAPTFYG